MLHARLSATTGRLSDISNRVATNPDDVPLAQMPAGFGPWTYDAVGKLAVPATLAETEKLDRLEMPPRVRAALVLRASSMWAGLSPQRKQRVMDIIDAYAAAVVDALT